MTIITLPAGFDVAALVSDFFGLALPFITPLVLIAIYTVITRLMRKV